MAFLKHFSIFDKTNVLQMRLQEDVSHLDGFILDELSLVFLFMELHLQLMNLHLRIKKKIGITILHRCELVFYDLLSDKSLFEVYRHNYGY